MSSQSALPASSLLLHEDRAEQQVELRFEDVYHDNFAFVWRSLRRVGVPEASLDDAAQDVFLVVLRRLPELGGARLVKPWLSAILMRVAADHRRRIRRREAPTRSDADGPPLDSLADNRGLTPQQCVEKSDQVRLLHRVLDELDWNKRQVFVLAELEQMSCPDIAESLRTPINTVYSRLRMARKEFNQALARYRASDEWRL